MAEITAALVKALRDKTGAGMMDSKKALVESDGDMDAAAEWLRAKGVTKATKKADRVAAEGLVGVAVEGGLGAVVEVNSETDFVARNADFQKMVGEIAQVAVGAGDDVAALNAATMPSSGKAVAEHVSERIATIGENMTVRRVSRLSAPEGKVYSYVHNAAAPGMGRIGVLVALKTTSEDARVDELGKQICMHIAFAKPAALSEADLDPQLIEDERRALSEQAKESGKPDNVIAKMVEGRLNKFYAEVCLLKQEFAVDPDTTVGKAVAAVAKDVGSEIEVSGFVRLEVGEGVAKEESDFAAEVAAAAKG